MKNQSQSYIKCKFSRKKYRQSAPLLVHFRITYEFRLKAVFYKTPSGNEPVREWLQSLSRGKKKTIGEDIKTIQFGWPLSIPLIRKLEPD